MSRETFFGELYLRSTRPLLSDAVSEQESAYLARAFSSHGVRGPIVDLGAGHGRHTRRLAARGWSVVGVERDPLSIRERERGPPMVRADFRQLPFRTGSLGGAYAWYSSLFIFPDEENAALLREVARTLMPGGVLVFQTLPYPYLARMPVADFRREHPDGTLLEESSRFDPETGRDTGRRTLTRLDGSVLAGQYSIRYYPQLELERLLREAGFRVAWMVGGMNDERLEDGSAELIVGAIRNG